MNTNDLRVCFLKYFESNGHFLVPSSSLVPSKDPSLLFTNAGMVQFKDIFLGSELPKHSCVASVQRCVRAGGKHNDLENVGYTKRHHTFFEMLGSFSFGNYFKQKAIQLAWSFLREQLKLPEDRLWITVYEQDQETEAIWLNEIKIHPERLVRCNEKDNFWSMGETGPCGPSTEIYYDHGSAVDDSTFNPADGDSDRFVEIWNLVFMQFNRDIGGSLRPLPSPCVDTGMGLERIAAVMQGVHDNYDIDLFQSLLQALSGILACKDFHDQSMRVIVDHIRSSAFMIMDGICPLNEGRGYVLRRIIRRAVRHGFKLGAKSTFFYRLVPALVLVMGEAYPELRESQDFIQQTIRAEEEQFLHTLSKGLKRLDQALLQLSGSELGGREVFQLYDTYGFPPDLTADITREQGVTIDYEGFKQAMDRQRRQSQQSSVLKIASTEPLQVSEKTRFVGYETLAVNAEVVSLLQKGQVVSELSQGEKGIVILNRSPFYAESGGQVGDTGYLCIGNTDIFRVVDTQTKGSAILHYGQLLEGAIRTGDIVHAEVDDQRRLIMLNHSATHLLHAALHRVLGDQVLQRGSLVEAKRLRFDFSYPKALTPLQIMQVEKLVNQQIFANLKMQTEEMSLNEAKAMGAIALFSEKYGERVRVVRMGDFSMEICGGTHLESTAEIGFFKVIAEEAVSAGIRRIVAVTGEKAVHRVLQSDKEFSQLGPLLGSGRDEIPDRVQQLIRQNRELNKAVICLKQRLAAHQSTSLVNDTVLIKGVAILVKQLPEADRETLRCVLDHLKSRWNSFAVLLATVNNNRVQLISAVSSDCFAYFNAIELLHVVTTPIHGQGGGRPNLAQGGSDRLENLSQALASAIDWIKTRLSC